jgi:Tfp pilus assembly protein PilX
MIKTNQQGFSFPTVLSFIIVAAIITAAAIQIVLTNFFVVGNNIKSQKAFNISEAGLNYYLWHLSHNSNDYKDGQSTPTTPDATLGYGPYTHDYIDDNAINQGTFTLWIKPQGNGSTVAKVRSIGKVKGSSIKRTTEAQIGATSFASYGVVSDSALWFGPDETADGPIHSNQGVEMDGSSNSTVSSANTTYIPPNGLHSSNYANGLSHPGVWCDTAVTSPVSCNTRDKSNWIYPSTQVDFNQVAGTLCTIKKAAFASYSATSSLASLSNACSQTPGTRTDAYIPQRSSSANASRGYLLELNPDNTYNLSEVNNVNDKQVGYAAALNTNKLYNNIPIPASGVIFAEDNVWVRSNPKFSGRVTIANGRLATSVTTDLTVADNLAYNTKNGDDAIGLVAEGNVYLAPFAPPSSASFTFEVDAAVLAQTGSVTYPSNYLFSNGTCTRGWVSSNQTLNFYGSIASRQGWTWSWLLNNPCGDSVANPGVSGQYISGFKYNTTHYDYNLLYNPPPSYPITGGYNLLSWREILTKP